MNALETLRYERYAPSSAFHPLDRNSVFVDWIGRNKRVLELGCSTGFISKHLVANGCTVTGVECDVSAAHEAKMLCEDVIVADLNCDWHKGVTGQFDVVACGDVLEHLINPSSVLETCHQFLAPHGKLVVCLPNVAFIGIRWKLLRGQWNYSDVGLLDRTHLRFFTVKTARQLISDAGYKIERFYPAAVGALRGSARFPSLAQKVANCLPGLLGYQLLFLCSPR